jgi:hypothetical protein
MRIFVSGPWGDFSGVSQEVVERNIQIADTVGQHLVYQGHEVFVPHNMYRTWTGKFSRELMMAQANSFLDHWAEAICRIPGYSEGADTEVARAEFNGLEHFQLSPIIQMLQMNEEQP